MPYVLAFNRPAIEDRLAALARYLDLPAASAGAVLDWVLELRREIGVPQSLAELGVGEQHVEEFARMAALDPTAPTNPVPLTAAQCATLYRQAIAGELAI